MNVVELARIIKKEKQLAGGQYWYGLARIRAKIDEILNEFDGNFGLKRQGDALYMGERLVLGIEICKNDLRAGHIYVRHYDPFVKKEADSCECTNHGIASFDSRDNLSEQLLNLEEIVAHMMCNLVPGSNGRQRVCYMVD